MTCNSTWLYWVAQAAEWIQLCKGQQEAQMTSLKDRLRAPELHHPARRLKGCLCLRRARLELRD